MKKISKIFLTLVIFIIPFVANMQMVSAEKLNYGDVDESGFLNAVDIDLIAKIVDGSIKPTPIQVKLADMNNDGKIDIIDQNILSNIFSTNATEGLLADKIKTENTTKSGYYKPNYNVDCVNGYGEDEKCIENYTFTNVESGVYVQQGDANKTIDGKPTYYFRGNVSNNYVQMGIDKNNNPMLWRIVRINEDNSIKLILENSIEGNVKWNSSNFSKYIDGDTNSDIKTSLENWYNENLKTDSYLDSIIKNSQFCNDISGIDFTKGVDRGNAAKRIYENYNPVFTCMEGSVVDKSKIGLLTADEAMFAGMSTNESNNDVSYLINNTNFWTITPFDSNRPFYIENNNNAIEFVGANSTSAAMRPVVNLNSDVTIISGNGTKNNPYVVGSFKTRPALMNTVNSIKENVITQKELTDAKSNNKTIKYETYNTSSDNGEWLYTWTIAPSDIANPKDIYTEIKFDALDNSDPVFSRMKFALGSTPATYFSFTQSGDFTSTATIDLKVSNKYADGKIVYVYRWNDEQKKYEVIATNKVVTDGKISFNVTKGDNYIITEKVLKDNQSNPQTGMMIFYIIGGVGLLLVIGIVFLIYSKKNNKFLKA